MAKEAKKKQVKEPKNKKSFGKELKSELKKVVWPKPAELFRSTLAVIVIVILITVIVFCLDFVFEAMNKYGIDKIKDSVQTTEEVENDDAEDNTTNEENSSEENSEESNSEETTEAEQTENVEE